MDRRRFVAWTAVALAAPIARAQQAGNVRRIGFLLPDREPNTPRHQRGGSVALRERGWIEDENLHVERAFANNDLARLPDLAKAMIGKRVDVIVTVGSEATLAAARATDKIPVVFANVIWPVEQGLIDSFAKPGRNLTGMSYYTGVEVTNKRLEFLREIAPNSKRLAWLWPPELAETVSGGSFDMGPAMESAARGLGFETQFHHIRKAGDVEGALARALSERTQAITAAGTYVTEARRQIADFGLNHRIPTAFPSFLNVEAGGLLGYFPSPSESPALIKRFWDMVDRVLRGTKPSELPVERPSKYDLLLNLKTARALGLTVPQALLLRADRVIE